MQFSPFSCVTSSLFGPDILLSTLFSNTLGYLPNTEHFERIVLFK
jgi:hypothetical protein